MELVAGKPFMKNNGKMFSTHEAENEMSKAWTDILNNDSKNIAYSSFVK